MGFWWPSMTSFTSQPRYAFSQLQVGKRIHCSPRRAHTSAGRKCEREGAEERNCYVLTISTSILSPVTHRVGRGVLSKGLTLSLGEWGRRDVVLMFVFFSLPKSSFAGPWYCVAVSGQLRQPSQDRKIKMALSLLRGWWPESAQLGWKDHWKGSRAITVHAGRQTMQSWSKTFDNFCEVYIFSAGLTRSQPLVRSNESPIYKRRINRNSAS